MPAVHRQQVESTFSQACVKNSVHGGRGVPAPGGLLPGGCLVETPETAAATGCTHPTGMHSCYENVD